MASNLIILIKEYLYGEIVKRIKTTDLNLQWRYKNGIYTFKFELVGAHFIVKANCRPKKNLGMSISPSARGISIECHNFLDNFDQVANILGEFEKELSFFEKNFPSTERCQFIRDNQSLLSSYSPRELELGHFNLNALSNRYIDCHNLVDEFGAKEIALDYIFERDFCYIMKKSFS